MRTALIATLGGAVGACGTSAEDASESLVWQAEEETVTDGAMGHLRMAFNNTGVAVRLPDDTLLVAWSEDGSLWLGRREPSAHTWAASSVPTLGLGDVGRPSLVQLQGEVLLAAWTERSGTGTTPHVVAATLSADGGLTWSAPRQLSGEGDADGVSATALEVEGRAGALVAWSELTGHGARFARWNGSTWNAAGAWASGALGAPAGALDIAVFSRGARAMAAWESSPELPASIWIADWDDGALSFAPASELTASYDGSFGDVGGCIDGDGGVYLGYQGTRRDAGGSIPQIYLVHADPGAPLAGLAPLALGPGLFAHVACDSQGTLAVAWEYFTTHAMDDAHKTVALTVSFDGNASREGPHAMPGSATELGRGYPSVALSSTRLDYFWQDIAGSSLTLRHREASLP